MHKSLDQLGSSDEKGKYRGKIYHACVFLSSNIRLSTPYSVQKRLKGTGKMLFSIDVPNT
jgi:hypothetical protein